MNTRLTQPIAADQLGKELGLSLIGPNREIREICSLDSLTEQGLSFILSSRSPAAKSAGTVFAAESTAAPTLTVIKSSNPRLDFIRAQHILKTSPGFLNPSTKPEIHPSVKIGKNTVIEDGVEVGEGTTIGSCVVIKSGTRIGKHCEIKSGAVIGEPGFGFERDENNRPLKMIHLGGVRIGDHVEIGSLSTVCRGALNDTVLESYVKLDDHVHIAHNCFIGEGTMITACAEISGSVKIGKNAWLAPNCSVIQKISLGDDCFVGIGAAVARSVEPGTKVFGNPAKRVIAAAPRPAETTNTP